MLNMCARRRGSAPTSPSSTRPRRRRRIRSGVSYGLLSIGERVRPAPQETTAGFRHAGVRKKRRTAPFGNGPSIVAPTLARGALEFLPSERYARNSFAGAITQASSITRGVRQ